VLDEAGGIDNFQAPPARVKVTAGTDALRCVRFSSKVLRWYADCCRTPIANTTFVDFPIIVWGVYASAAMHMPKIQGAIENE
jgi:Family of unknown function (DUF6151)